LGVEGLSAPEVFFLARRESLCPQKGGKAKNPCRQAKLAGQGEGAQKCLDISKAKKLK